MIRIVSDSRGFALTFDSEAEVDLLGEMLKRLKKYKKKSGRRYPGVVAIWDDRDPEYPEKASNAVHELAKVLKPKKPKNMRVKRSIKM